MKWMSWIIACLLLNTVNAQTDSIGFFEKVYLSSDIAAIDKLLKIPDACGDDSTELRIYRCVTKSDNPRFFFECTAVRKEGNNWQGAFYGVMITGGKHTIRRYSHLFTTFEGKADSLITLMENADFIRPAKEAEPDMMTMNPLITYCKNGQLHRFTPDIEIAAYNDRERDEQGITVVNYRNYYKMVGLFDRLFNKMIEGSRKNE